jgi:hypothetical protein
MYAGWATGLETTSGVAPDFLMEIIGAVPTSEVTAIGVTDGITRSPRDSRFSRTAVSDRMVRLLVKEPTISATIEGEESQEN